MPENPIEHKINLCEANRDTESFASSVEDLLNMLPPDVKFEVEKDDGIYKTTETYVNRFINNVIVSVEFVPVQTLDHEALYSAILSRIKKA